MVFKRLSLERIQFSEENINVLKRMLKKQCATKYPLTDILQKMTENGGRRIKNFKRQKECVVRDMITALILCHNVTPVDDNGQRTFQASSPDEIALVNIAEDVGMRLNNRFSNLIDITNANGENEKY